jgi:Zn-dependent alcohol dehydrogenase
VGIGNTALARRAELYGMLCGAGIPRACLVHPRARVARSARVGDGTVVFAGSVVGTGVEVGADVVIDAVGRPETWKQAFYARDLAGTVVLVGVPTPDMTLEMPLIDFFSHGGSLKSSWYGDCLPSRDFPMLIDLYLQGRLDLDRFVSETIKLDEVENAFHKMERGEVLRSVVVL